MKAIMFFLKIFTASTLTGNPIGFPLTPPPKKKNPYPKLYQKGRSNQRLVQRL